MRSLILTLGSLGLAVLLSAAPKAQNTPPTLSIAVDRAIATEGTPRPVVVELRLDRPAPAGGVCVEITLAGGTAVQGEDFRLAEAVPSIPAGGSIARLLIEIIDDTQSEPDETLRIVLAPSACYQRGSSRDFSLLIRDDDDDPAALANRLQQLINNSPDPLVASQLSHLGELCATSQPPPGSELDRRCQLLRLALRNPAAAQQLLNSLRGVIGEELSSQRRGFRMLAGSQLGAIGRRLEAVRGGAGAGLALVDSGIGSGNAFLPLAANVEADDALLSKDIGVFASIVLGDSSREATDLESGYDSDSDTYLLGIDKRFDRGWVLGMALSRTRFEADLDAGAGTLELRQTALTAYASYAFDQGWIDGSLGAGRGEVRQTRIAQFDAVTDEESVSERDVLAGSPDAALFTAQVSAGWDWQRGGLSFGPRAALEYARFRVDRFAERAVIGSDAFAVEIDEQTLRSVLARLGLGSQWVISTRHGVLLPQLDAYWVTQFEDQADALRGRFVNDPRGQSFLLPTSAIDAHYGEASASLAMQFLRGWSGYVSYRRLFAIDQTEQSYWSLGFRIEF